MGIALLFGCGPSAQTPDGDDSTGGETCSARADADALADRLEACRAAQASQEPWPAQEAYDALFEQVRSHLTSTTEPREVTSEEAQPIADAIWAFLDQLTFPGQSQALRTRAEEAAEGLLRDRGRDQSAAAAQAAYEAVTSIRATLDPPEIDPCAELAESADRARVHAGQVCI